MDKIIIIIYSFGKEGLKYKKAESHWCGSSIKKYIIKLIKYKKVCIKTLFMIKRWKHYTLQSLKLSLIDKEVIAKIYLNKKLLKFPGLKVEPDSRL